VTVNPAGLNAPHGVIGSGKINGKNWRLVAQKPGTGGVPDTSQCFLAEGAAVSADQDCEPVPYAGAGDAVDLSSIFGSQAEIQFGVVAQGVDRITVTLADGTVLVLHPTEAYGQRYVAFAIPLPPTITTIVAYSRRAELSYAIPFNSATDSTTGVWLRPGQGGLPRASYRIGSGSVDGKSWSDTVHVGPWGYCITGADGGDCYATESVSLGNQVGPITDDGPSTTNYAVGTATAAVSYVRVTLSNGGLITARAVDAGGPRFFAFAIPKGDRLVKVTYCAASGRQLASQSASQIY
jgi:hypothetical protein